MSDWISVEDRQPPKSHEEIVTWNGKYPKLLRYLGSKNGGGYFYNYHDEIVHGITHWMLLPEPPQ